MVLSAVRGALGFLTRLPVGAGETEWNAFRTTPATFPLAGYVIGTLVGAPLLLATVVPPPTVVAVVLAWIYLLTGITHLDGVCDLGDAAVVHGDASERARVLTDTAVGVGGLAAGGVVVIGTALGLVGLTGLPLAVAIPAVIAAEVGAKTAMAAVACLGRARHEGLGSAFTGPSSPRLLVGPLVVAAPVALLSWPSPVAGAALVGAVLGGSVLAAWASRVLEGVSGDVIGAANEVGRLVGLHAGVVAWTLS